MKGARVVLWVFGVILLISGVGAGGDRVQAIYDSVVEADQGMPYLPNAAAVVLTPVLDEGLMHVDVTFPSGGYQVAAPGNVAVAAGINPDGSIYYSYLTNGVRLEKSSGIFIQCLTTKRITYKIRYGAKTYFAFRVNYNGSDINIKDITVIKTIQPNAIVNPTPTPVPSSSSSPNWVLPNEDQVTLTAKPAQKIVYVDLAFPDNSYRVANSGSLKLFFGRGGWLFWNTQGVQIEKTDEAPGSGRTRLRLAYEVKPPSTYPYWNRFSFNVLWEGKEVLVKSVEFAYPTPYPSQTPVVTPTPK